MAVGRFQVMAVLQAARAFELGLPLESAFSWGLNRAIFYAAAKRGFKGKAPSDGRHGRPTGARPSKAPTDFLLGDELAFKEDRDGTAYFTIGGKAQTEDDFERQISSRFRGTFEEVWDESLDYVRKFDRGVLLSGAEFFSSVYKPRRDELASKWTGLSEVDEKKKTDDDNLPPKSKSRKSKSDRR